MQCWQIFFQTDKNPINITDIDISKVVLFNKVSYVIDGAYKYYVGLNK